MYAPVRVSTRITSPISTNDGHWISAPVSTLTGLVTLVAVFPLAPGSQYSTFNSTWFGGVMVIGLLLNRTIEPAHLGNFLEGKVTPKTARCPQESCPSIVSYAHREDNEFAYKKHLDDYVDRNRRHRLKVGTG